MIEIAGMEILTENFHRTELIGLACRVKKFMPEIIVYLEDSINKIQIVSKIYTPNQADLLIKKVNAFTIPFTDAKYYIPKDESDVLFVLEDNIEIDYAETEPKNKQFLHSNLITLGIEKELEVILNKNLLEETTLYELTKRIG